MHLLLFLLVFYILFIRGKIWIAFLCICGFYGARNLILNVFDGSEKTLILFANTKISWAATIAFGIVVLGYCYIKEN